MLKQNINLQQSMIDKQKLIEIDKQKVNDKIMMECIDKKTAKQDRNVKIFQIVLQQIKNSMMIYQKQKKPIKKIFDDNYEKYRSKVYNPRIISKRFIQGQQLQQKAKQIYQFARNNGASYYTFFAYPSNQGVMEKQQTFLDLKYFFNQTFLNSGQSRFSFQQLGKGEGDGSSFPSGGLRVKHQARAYTVWDTQSQIFIRKNNVLYIPSLLVTHNGEAMDDKTLFRKAQKILQHNTLQLLKRLEIKATASIIALGLQQQFFVIKKQILNQRLDLKTTGRALIGKIPPKNQQFSDHYYGKIPSKIQNILREIQDQLLEIGVPCKTRHKQVAPNQFQFCPLFQDAGKAIDHNMILMQILKQKFQAHGLAVLLHQKPFANLNGSGKHCNWSLNYVDQDGSIHNLFEIPKCKANYNLFRVFVLVQLKALLKHSKLYLSAISCSGNELRLGGYQAPPSIMSAFLGETVSSIIDGNEVKLKSNLKNELPNIPFDLLQEDTDRNRTSPFAYTGNKFQFRAVGSSQNVCYPVAVIAATMADAMKDVCARLDSGKSVENVICQLREQTKDIRYNGNGYSREWVETAKSRGLYVNQKFYENYQNLREGGKLFVELQICKQQQLQAKVDNSINNYINTVITQKNCLLNILSEHIVPRCYQFLRLVQPRSSSQRINKRSQLFINAFQNVLEKEDMLRIWDFDKNLKDVSQLRQLVNQTSQVVNKVLEFLPKSKHFPEFQDFIHQY